MYNLDYSNITSSIKAYIVICVVYTLSYFLTIISCFGNTFIDFLLHKIDNIYFTILLIIYIITFIMFGALLLHYIITTTGILVYKDVLISVWKHDVGVVVFSTFANAIGIPIWALAYGGWIYPNFSTWAIGSGLILLIGSIGNILYNYCNKSSSQFITI